MPEEELKAIADEAASKAVEQMMLSLGFDVSTPAGTLQAQKDLTAMRELARTVSEMKAKGVIAVWVLLVTAIAGLIWTGLKDIIR